MQRSPMGGGLNLTKSMLLKALLLVITLAVVYYAIDYFLGSFFAWGVVILIGFNVYLLYRVSIRRTLDQKIFGEDEFYESKERPSQVVPQESSPEIEKQQSTYEAMQQTYEKCPKCEGKVIPGLQYCEECGHQLEP